MKDLSLDLKKSEHSSKKEENLKDLTLVKKKCNREHENLGVGSLIKCPRNVSETGWLKIVGDQTNCAPNIQQAGVTNWKYLAIEFDVDRPDEVREAFEITKEEITKWESYV